MKVNPLATPQSGLWLSAGRPPQVSRVDAGTAGRTEVVAQPYPSDESSVLAGSGADELGIDTVVHELGPTEHVEPSAGGHVPPGEVQKPVISAAVHRTTGEVEAAVGPLDHADVQLPASCLGIGGDELDRVPAHLNADLDVVERTAGRVTEPATGKVIPLNDHPHIAIFPISLLLTDPLAALLIGVENVADVALPAVGGIEATAALHQHLELALHPSQLLPALANLGQLHTE